MTIAGLGVLAPVVGAVGGIAALTGDDTRAVTAVRQDTPVVDQPPPPPPVPVPSRTGTTGLGAGAAAAVAGRGQAERADRARSAPGEADRSSTRSPRRPASDDRPRRTGGGTPTAGGTTPAASPAVAKPAEPRVRTVRVSKTEAIPFRTTLIRDPFLPPGSRETDTPGVPGERLLRYQVTYTGDRETSRRLLNSTVTREPQDRVVVVGDPGDGDPGDGDPGDGDPGDGDSGDGDRGDDDGDGRHRGGEQECRLLGSCVQTGGGAECTHGDEPDVRPGSISNDDPGLLDPTDVNELEPNLPCEDKARAAAG